MSTLARTVREIRLGALPDGLPGPDDFVVAEVPMPVPGNGEALVRNRWFQVFPSVRTLIGGGVPGMPFPPLRPGDTLFGAAIGEVVTAPAGSGLRPGELVRHWRGWREYAALPAADCTPLGDDLPDPVAHLGQAAVAYTALTRDAPVHPGDTVLVTGGAGGVGALAGQMARLLGAGRVIGTTGTPHKAARMTTDLGYDAVVLRDPPGTDGGLGADVFAERLAAAAPGGVDVVVDNVGGEQLRAAVGVARDRARFVIVGALSGQLSPDRAGTSSPTEIDTFQLIAKRIQIRGFGGADDAATRPEWARRFGGWLRDGAITFPYARVPGIERAPRALHDLIAGHHVGTVIVEL